MTGIDDINGACEDALQLAFKFDDDFIALAPPAALPARRHEPQSDYRGQKHADIISVALLAAEVTGRIPQELKNSGAAEAMTATVRVPAAAGWGDTGSTRASEDVRGKDEANDDGDRNQQNKPPEVAFQRDPQGIAEKIERAREEEKPPAARYDTQ